MCFVDGVEQMNETSSARPQGLQVDEDPNVEVFVAQPEILSLAGHPPCCPAHQRQWGEALYGDHWLSILANQ